MAEEEPSFRRDDRGEDGERQSQEAVLSEELQAQRLAERLELEYVDLEHFEIDAELFRSIPVDLMFRYNFVPRHKYRRRGSRSSSPIRPTC